VPGTPESRIEIVEYKPSWPSEFGAIGARLRSAFGDAALRIDHIGSTAVPGLAAKDVIDIQVTVSNLDDFGIRRATDALGLVWKDDVECDHAPPGSNLGSDQLSKRLAIQRAPARHANVHIRLPARFNQRYALLCRDFLRAHPATCEAYAEVKRQLAKHFPHDIAAYYDVKDPAFDLFMSVAPGWADNVRWQPGPSDA
jgi:GrpB-like predicted nucleotidyltransferase (UPF0157 family)